MIIKFFSSSSFKYSVKSLFGNFSGGWSNFFIDCNGLFLSFDEYVSNKEFQKEVIKEFDIWWKVLIDNFIIKERCDTNKVCFSILMYFNPDDRVLNNIEKSELIKDWLIGHGLDPNDLYYIAFSVEDSTPNSIHIILSRSNLGGKLVKLNPWKNMYVTRSLEKKYGLTVTDVKSK